MLLHHLSCNLCRGIMDARKNKSGTGEGEGASSAETLNIIVEEYVRIGLGSTCFAI